MERASIPLILMLPMGSEDIKNTLNAACALCHRAPL